jgi:hypothetical protein
MVRYQESAVYRRAQSITNGDHTHLSDTHLVHKAHWPVIQPQPSLHHSHITFSTEVTLESLLHDGVCGELCQQNHGDRTGMCRCWRRA